MMLAEATGDPELVLEILGTLCTSILVGNHARVVICHIKQVDQMQIEERKKVHIGITILTTVLFAMWAYKCDPTGYNLSGWIALITIVTTFTITIAYNTLRVIKLYKSL